MKMSKLDRFLVSDGILDSFLDLTEIVLDRFLLNHRPIILKEMLVDYSPVSFHLFYSWFLEDDFVTLVEETWRNYEFNNSNGLISLKNKLQLLKSKVKFWSGEKIKEWNAQKIVLKNRLLDIHRVVDTRVATSIDLEARVSTLKEIDDIVRSENLDLAQKEKVKLAIKGDENTSYFHGVINNKYDNLLFEVLCPKGCDF